MINIYQQVYNNLILKNNFKFSLNDLEKSFINVDKIPANLSQDIIKESSFLFTLSDNFINMILNCQNGTMYIKDILLPQFEETSKEYQKILSVKQEYPIFIYKVNFTISEISNIINDFCIGQNNKQTKIIARNFIDENWNLAGAVISLPKNVKILLFNNKLLSKQVIIHEFYHYLQDITKFGFINKQQSQLNKLLSDKKTKKILKNYGFSQYTFKYLFSKKEFWPHINDLCHILNNIYFKYYQNLMQPIDFFNKFINSYIFSKDLTFTNKIIDQYSQLTNDECSPLYMIKLAYLLNFKYDIIFEKLQNTFLTI